MGKYMRKAKGVGEVAVMEVSQSSFGVRTRARALALEKDRKIAHNSRAGSFNSPQAECNEPRQTSYLELRSRRLEKVVRSATAREEGSQSRGLRKAVSERRSSEMSSSEMLDDSSSRFVLTGDARHSLSQLATSAASDRGRHDLGTSRGRARAVEAPLQSSIKGSVSASLFPNSGAGRGPAGAAHSRSNSVSIPQDRSRGILTRNQRRREKQTLLCPEDMDVDAEATHRQGDAGPSAYSKNTEMEVSFGENPMDHDGLPARDRRETTPNSYERDIEAPGSATRPPPSARNRRRSASAPPSNRLLTTPSSNEIEEFFAGAEQQHDQRRFIERYNFDPVNDRPLPGRFQWVSLEP